LPKERNKRNQNLVNSIDISREIQKGLSSSDEDEDTQIEKEPKPSTSKKFVKKSTPEQYPEYLLKALKKQTEKRGSELIQKGLSSSDEDEDDIQMKKEPKPSKKQSEKMDCDDFPLPENQVIKCTVRLLEFTIFGPETRGL
jgi:hypothetical protein